MASIEVVANAKQTARPRTEARYDGNQNGRQAFFEEKMPKSAPIATRR
jgi:hypothetical protein